jgi:hypothetical protein
VARITGSFDFSDLAGIGPARGIVDLDQLAIGLGDFVAHAGRGGDEFERELALQALLNDLHVQQAEKAATEAEPKAAELSGSKKNDESFRRSFSSASRRRVCSCESTV